MTNKIQISRVVVRIKESDPTNQETLVEYYLTDSPEIINYLDTYTAHLGDVTALEALPGWPEGIDFT